MPSSVWSCSRSGLSGAAGACAQTTLVHGPSWHSKTRCPGHQACRCSHMRAVHAVPPSCSGQRRVLYEGVRRPPQHLGGSASLPPGRPHARWRRRPPHRARTQPLRPWSHPQAAVLSCPAARLPWAARPRRRRGAWARCAEAPACAARCCRCAPCSGPPSGSDRPGRQEPACSGGRGECQGSLHGMAG